MADQTNVIFNTTGADVTVALTTSGSTVVPKQGKTPDAGVTGTDAEWTTIAATAGLFVGKGPLTRTQREILKTIARHSD